MSKKSKGGGGGVSFMPEDAIESGLFSSGPATIKESIFAKYNYGGSAKPTPVWLVTYARDGEEDYEQPYSLGKGWKVSDDGSELIALNGQTGLPKSCNAMKYLIGPLYEALQAADKDPSDFLTGDPSALDGLDVIVKRVPQEKREGLPARKGKDGKDAQDKERTILVVEEVTEGDAKPKKKGATKSKKSEDEDDEDEDDEKPTKAKGKTKPAADDDDDDDSDDDDDDAKPTKGKAKAKKSKDEDEDDDEADDDDEDEAPAKSKGKAKAKGKAKDEDEENELDEEATEALVAALEAADGPIKVKDLQQAVLDGLKGNPQKKALAARVCEEDFLEKETSWSFNGKVVEAS